MDDKAFISDIEYLSLQASIICLLLFILSTTTIIDTRTGFNRPLRR